MILKTKEEPAMTGWRWDVSMTKGTVQDTCTYRINQHLRKGKRTHTVEGKSLMPDQNRPQLILVGKLCETLQRHKQDGQERSTTKCKGRVCGVLLIVECTSCNQRLEDCSAVLCCQRGSIPQDQLCLSASQEGDLPPERNGIVATCASLVLFTFMLGRLLKCLASGMVDHVLLVVFQFLIRPLLVIRLLPSFRHLFWARRHLALEPFLRFSCNRVCARVQVIGGGLSGLPFESDGFFKVLDSILRRTKVDEFTGIDEQDLVEEIPQAVTCLIKCDECRSLGQVGQCSQCLDVLHGRTRVQTSCGRIPHGDQRSTGEHFTDGHSFLFSTGNASQLGIADSSAKNAFEAEDFTEDVHKVVDELLTGLTFVSLIRSWGPARDSEAESLFHAERRHVHVFLGCRVQRFS